MTPSLLSSPEVLILGSDIGTAQAKALLRREVPKLHAVPEPCESPRSSEEAWEILLRATGRHAPAAVFVASHAFSALLPEFAEGDIGIPLHRTLPPLADAARLTCTRRVALVALPETLAAEETQMQLGLYADRGLKITPVPATDLIYAAGRYARDGALPDIMALRDFMEPVRTDARIDSVILASAHAVALRGMLEKAAFRPFYWIDGMAVSVRRFLMSRAEEASSSDWRGFGS